MTPKELFIVCFPLTVYGIGILIVVSLVARI
jgi:hypothetical protein